MARWLAIVLLTCLGCLRSVSRFARAGVAPVIASFTATPPEVSEGDTITLSAGFTDGAASIAGLGAVGPNTSATVVASLAPLLPQAVSTYVLSLTGAGGLVTTAQASVIVHRAPAAVQIFAGASVHAGSLLSASVASQPGVTFAWEAQGATIVSAPIGESILLSVTKLGEVRLSCVGTNALGRHATATRNVTVDGWQILAGDTRIEGFVEGSGSAARFSGISGIADDGNGGVYVSDTDNQVIRHIDAAGATTTVAGTAGQSGNSDGAVATFDQPKGLVRLADGDLLVADASNHSLRRVHPNGATTTVLNLPSGKPFGVALADDASLFISSNRASEVALTHVSSDFLTTHDVLAWPLPTFGLPYSFAINDATSIIAADPQQTQIDIVSVSDGSVRVLAGTPMAGGFDPAAYRRAPFTQGPTTVLSDDAGGAYAFDLSADGESAPRLRHVLKDGTVTSVVGDKSALPWPTGFLGAWGIEQFHLALAGEGRLWLSAPSVVILVSVSVPP